MAMTANELGTLFLILMLSIGGEAVEKSDFDGMAYLKSHGINPEAKTLFLIIDPGDKGEMKKWTRQLESSIYILRKNGADNLALQGRSAIAFLKKYGLTSSNQAVRENSIEIIKKIREDFPDERFLWRAAVQVLGSRKDRQAVPRLLELLNDEDPAIRGEAIKALARINDPGTADGLVEVLETEAANGAAGSSLAELIMAYCGLARDEDLARIVPFLGKGSFESDLVILETLTKRAAAGDWAGAVVGAASGKHALLLEGGLGAPVEFARETLRKLYGIKDKREVDWGKTLRDKPAAYKNMSKDELKAVRKGFSDGLQRLSVGVRYFSLLSYLDFEGLSAVAGVDADMLHNSALGSALRDLVNGNADLKAIRGDLLLLTGDYRIERMVAVLSEDYSADKGYAGLLLEGFFNSGDQAETLLELYGEKNAKPYRQIRIFTSGEKSPVPVAACVVGGRYMLIFMGADSEKRIRVTADALIDKIKRRESPVKMLHPSRMFGVGWCSMKVQPSTLLKQVPALSALSNLKEMRLQLIVEDGIPAMWMTGKCAEGGAEDAVAKLRALFEGDDAPFKALAAKAEFESSGDSLKGRIEFPNGAFEKGVTEAIMAFAEPRLKKGRVGILKMRVARMGKAVADMSQIVEQQQSKVAKLEQFVLAMRQQPFMNAGLPKMEENLEGEKAVLAKQKERLAKLEQKHKEIEMEMNKLEKGGE